MKGLQVEEKILKVGLMISYQFFELSGTGIPQLARIQNTYQQFTWSDYSPYYMALPPKNGSLPNCRGCKKPIERTNLYIRVKVITCY